MQNQRRILAVLWLSTLALSTSSHAADSIREEKTFGPILEICKTVGLIGAAFNATHFLRVLASTGIEAETNYRVIKAGTKILPFKSNFSPFVGAEYWIITGNSNSFGTGGGALTVGVDYTFKNGINLGGNYTAVIGKAQGGCFSVGYFF